MAGIEERFDLSELDLPSEAPAARPAPAPSPAPAPAPTALDAARGALSSATTIAGLNAAATALTRQYPDASHPVRAAVRPLYEALYRALFIVQVWGRIFRSLSAGVAERPALVASAASAPVAAPHTGTFARYQGSWLGFIPHSGRAVRPGEHVTLVRRNGGAQTFAIGEVVDSRYRTAGQVGSIVTFDVDHPVAAPATERQPIPVVSDAPAPEVTASAVPGTPGSFLNALADAANESAANAATQASGSLAGGTMAGVGFTSAAGYVQALANGCKRATADGYLATLRSRYGYSNEQIAALTVTIIPEGNALPEGPGITHTPTGPDIFTARHAERARAAQELRATADAATVALAQRFATTGADVGAWWEIGWDGCGSITRGEVLAACGIAPEAKAPETQLGRTCDSLRGTHDCSAVTPPAGVRRRWQIGRGRQHAAYVGAEYGRVLAIVDLMPDGQLRWEGDAAICAEVRAEYDRLTSEEILRAGDITSWLSQLLRYRFAARRSAHNYLVPPERREQARELCTRLASVWARGSWLYGRLDLATGEAEIGKYVTDVGTILGGLLVACSDEVSDAEKSWQTTVDAAKGGKVGARAAASALLRHDGDKPGEGILARVDGLARVMGEGPLAPLKARCAALRGKILAAVDAAGDSTSARAAMLELE